jgi:hypothetical protein
MNQRTADRLKRALAQLKSGNPQDARSILVDILKDDPEVEQAWYMLSFAVPSPERQVYSLRQALKINPYYDKARERLEKLTGEKVDLPAVPMVEEEEPASRDFSAPEVTKEPEPEPEDVVQPAWEEPQDASEDLLSQRLFGGGSEDKEADVSKPSASSARQQAGYSATVPIEKSEEAPKEKKPKKERKPLNPRTRRMYLLGILVVILIGIGGYAYNNGLAPLLSNLQSVADKGSPIKTSTPTKAEVVPTSTSEPTATSQLEPTNTLLPTATRPAVPTSSPPPLAPDIQAAMDDIQAQVLTIRGAADSVAVNNYFVSQAKIQEVLETTFFSPAFSTFVENEELVYQALGLSGPSYDLRNHFMNMWVEGLGGVYDPEANSIYITGLGFNAVEQFIYSQLFTQALIDNQIGISTLGFYPECQLGSQACEAVYALVKGDASFLQQQWATRFTSSEDKAEIDALEFQPFFIGGSLAPAFAEADLAFPYVQGASFVERLVNGSGWSAVDNAYLNPPTTTEQILHPEKYLSGEEAVVLDDSPLSTLLGDEWREIKNGALGEWKTFLILAYGDDPLAQQEKDVAASAAAGWGGDQVQVYYNDKENSSVLLAHWTWDTPTDAEEFADVMLEYVGIQFFDQPTEISGGLCWDGETAMCLLAFDQDVVWVSSPDMDIAQAVLGLFPIE